MNALVSVIIPVYNREAVLEECVNSVLGQTYDNLEIILIDDGSQDSSPELCRSLAENNPKIKFAATDHGGVSVARNLGLKEAKGEYIFFVDSDDAIHPYLLEDLMDGLTSTDAAIAGSDLFNIADKNWELMLPRLMEDNTKSLWVYKPFSEAIDDFFKGKSTIGTIGGVLFKKELVGDTEFKSDLFIGEDFYFIYENLIKGASCIFLEEKRYFARIHKANSSWNYTFSGFYTRFLRRRLVWENEEKLGRAEYSNFQKRDAISSFHCCVLKNKPYSRDARRMRKTVKKHKTELMSACSGKLKLLLWMSLYTPFTFAVVFKMKAKIKK